MIGANRQSLQGMGMSGLTVPLSVSQNVNRAKSLFKRDEPLRALDSLLLGLDLYTPEKLLGKARFAIEVSLMECVQELNRQPRVRALIEELSGSSTAQVAYTPGQEESLKKVLPILRKALHDMEVHDAELAQQEKLKRKNMLEQKGLEYLRKQDWPRAKAALRRVADEFGEENGVLVQIGEWLYEANQLYEAVEFLEQSIVAFPRNSKAYGLAAKCYIALHECDKAESIYLKALKEFGRHPVTLANLAKMYMTFNKKEKAFEAAQSALALDSSNADAKEIFAALS